MKNIIKHILIFFTSGVFACGGGEWEGMAFYNLFMQTNISAEEFYPFLRDEYNNFYGDDYYYKNKSNVFPNGNVSLWNELLSNWSKEDIQNALYKPEVFNWNNRNSKLEKHVKTYIDFAHYCSKAFEYRNNYNSWDYDEVIKKDQVDTEELLMTANKLLKKESNKQLKMRYYYQIIRILHYSEKWDEAVRFFESKINNQLPKNELYYYILDQAAGCYYSLKQYDKAAYYFTKILNKSIDRKKSAFLSYNFCSHKNAEGKPFFNGIDDEKDLLLIKSLRDFSDEVNNIRQFIKLDPKDNRIELLFMRALSNVERNVLPKYLGVNSDINTLPYLKESKAKVNNLLYIAEQQTITANNPDFWQMASSYLSFIKQDIPTAKQKLTKVNSFLDQKKILNLIYEIFTWKTITSDNENFLANAFKTNKLSKKDKQWNTSSQSDWFSIIEDKLAHTYYTNGHIAKAFLVHNSVENTNNISSLELLNALEKFYNKPNKSNYEKQLVKRKSDYKISFIDYVNYQKGIYYLNHEQPEMALNFFEKNNSYVDDTDISGKVFSNNIKECFECSEDNVMDDEVYKASIFSFIKSSFSRKELAENLLELKKLTKDQKQWKSKLAHYLLGNYYYNISNTGYYRGVLTGDSNCCEYAYISYANTKTAETIIANKTGYNLFDISYYEKKYFKLSDVAMIHYQKVIEKSTDKELNARCLYLMAKCELNTFYNHGKQDGFTVNVNEYYSFKLPYYESFKTLKNDYSDTKFHDMIIQECSYFKLYSATY
jgi:hypothetical protein